MKKILILGTTKATVKAVEEIRASDKESEMTVFAFDGHYPYDRGLFPKLVAKELKLNEVLFKPKDFYERHRVKFIFDKKLAKVNFKKHKMTTEEKDQIEYDLLLITEAPQYKFPDIRGINKTGVFGLKRLQDIQRMIDLASVSDTIVLQSDCWEDLKIAEAFARKGKEVFVLVSAKSLWAGFWGSEIAEKITRMLEAENFRLIYENPIAEVLGDGDAKAVRLNSGKVIACGIVIFGETEPDFKIFSDSPLNIRKKICVNRQFKTNIDNVFALAETAESESPEDKEEADRRRGVTVRTLQLERFLLMVLGNLGEFKRENLRELQKFNEETKIYKKLFLENNHLAAAILVNGDQEKAKFQRLIEDQTNLQGVEDIVLDESSGHDRVMAEIGKK